MGSKARTGRAAYGLVRRSWRAVLGASAFSLLAGWIVRAIAVVTVLALAAASVLGGVAGLAVYGLYVGVGYDRFYDAAVRWTHFGRASDFAVRTVGYPLGALALAGVFAALGSVDPTGTFAGLLPGNNPAIAVLFEGIGVLPVGLLLVVTGGLLVAEAGATLVRRVALSRADVYVGVSEPTGRIALTGTVIDGRSEDRTDGTSVPDEPGADVEFEPYEATVGTSENGDAPESVAATPDGVGDDSGDRFVTDGGRRAAATDGSGDRERLALSAYDPGDPVVVDADANRVVATGEDCTPDDWILTVVTYLLKDFYEKHGVDLRDDRETLHRLRIVAKRIREDFEERTETDVLLPFVADVPDEGAVHIRKTLTAVPPSDGDDVRPPFATVAATDADRSDPTGRDLPRDPGHRRDPGPNGAESGGRDTDGDPGADRETDAATFDPTDDTGRPVDDPADESIVDAEMPNVAGPSLTAPHTGTDCVGYDHRSWEHRVRTVEVAGRSIPVPGRRLETFETDVAPFDVRTFGTTVRVAPEDPKLLLDLDRVADEASETAYEATVGPGESVTVVGTLEPSDDPEYDYELAEGPPGGVVVSDRTPEDLSGALSRGVALRLGAGVPLLVLGTALTPLVDLAPATVLGVVLAVVAASVAGGLAVSLGQYLPDYVREPVAGAVSRVADRIR